MTSAAARGATEWIVRRPTMLMGSRWSLVRLGSYRTRIAAATGPRSNYAVWVGRYHVHATNVASSRFVAELRTGKISGPPATNASEVARDNVDLLQLYQPRFADFEPPPPPEVMRVASTCAAGDPSPQRGGSSTPSPPSSSPVPNRVVVVVQETRKERKLRLRSANCGTNVFTPQMLVPILPFFFIPLDALLAELPEGYTEQHVEQVFVLTGTVELVQLQGSKYVRLHGGKRFVDFTSTSRITRQRREMDRVSWSHITRNARACSSDVLPLSVMDDVAIEEQVLDAEVAYAQFEDFGPNPRLCPAFIQLLPRANQWLSLRELLMKRAPAALREHLFPFTEYQSLMFFAQMQHCFNFSPAGEGEVCYAHPVTHLTPQSSPTPSVVNELLGILKSNLGDGSRMHHSATHHLVPGRHSSAAVESAHFVGGASMSLADLMDPKRQPPYGLSSFARMLILLYYDTLENFLLAHQDIFAYDATSHLVAARSSSSLAAVPESSPRPLSSTPVAGMPPDAAAPCRGVSGARATALRLSEIYGTGVTERIDGSASAASVGQSWGTAENAVGDRALVTLEDRLEKALARHDRRICQKLRRQIAIRKNPDCPYTDREILFDAILRYVPQRRSISLRFLLKSLPTALTDFLPDEPMKLFRAFAVSDPSDTRIYESQGTRSVPGKIVIFEFRVKNNIHIIRTGQPIPEGCLRFSYSLEELAFMAATEVSEKSRRMSDIFGRLPYAAREQVRKEYKGLLQVLQHYPENFLIVFPDAVRMDGRSALVTLLKFPRAPQVPVASPTVKNARVAGGGHALGTGAFEGAVGTAELADLATRPFSPVDWGNIVPSPEQRQYLEDMDFDAIKDLPAKERAEIEAALRTDRDIDVGE